MAETHSLPLRLNCSRGALAANWQTLDAMSGAASCGAAVKANGYGLGAEEVVKTLLKAGCRNFFVATWAEAREIEAFAEDAQITVLNGVLPDDMAVATSLRAKPMLNSARQIELWRQTGLPCDVMINSGMNRLGINPAEACALDWSGIAVDTLASHLASADENSPQNQSQLEAFRTVFGQIPHQRKSLANSAGIALGADYAFDLTRPGLSLYGGVPRDELSAHIQPVGQIEAQILQTRTLQPGDQVGYNATFTATRAMTVAIISVGYADGYLRGFSGKGIFHHDGQSLPVVGRVSMDLVALDISGNAGLGEGDWLSLPLDLPVLSAQSGLSQYEVLTTLGRRFDRRWA